jgi:hypothetical protein
VDDPAELNDAESRSQDKLNDGDESAALHELSESWDEGAAKGGKGAACGSLLCHIIRI